MMVIPESLAAKDLVTAVGRLFELAAPKISALHLRWNPADGTPVFTAGGKYTTRGWTEWTQGFAYGAAILVFDGIGDAGMLELGRRLTVERMASHVTHRGVHDHGFNNVSTYGNLRRLMREGRIAANEWEMRFYEMALEASGAVQAMRWMPAGADSAPGKGDGSSGGPFAEHAQGPRTLSMAHGPLGYVYSFNGPQSLFVDTIRSMRALAVAHQLGQVLMEEGDVRVSLLQRLVRHGLTTAKYNVYYGEGRDSYDVPGERGRTCHEAIFNVNDGRFRCPSSQQGYSPFSTWTRGLAWAMLGFTEELEFLAGVSEVDFAGVGVSKGEVMGVFEKAARATCDFYIGHACVDGVCYWDTGAPGLARMGDYLSRAAEPFNEFEPVDSSAGAIAAQGLLRLGRFLKDGRYERAGLVVARTLLAEPYLSVDPGHEGLLLHSVYHRPNGWDYVPAGRKVPCEESSMWGDYHLLELGVLIQRMVEGRYVTFFD